MKFVKRTANLEVSPSFVQEASSKFNITPKIMEQIILRGNDTVEKIQEYLFPTQKSMLNPFDLSGMYEFVKRIQRAKQSGEKVLVFGDYDVDGISATAIMIKTLNLLGIDAKFFLPNRYVDGYGLTNEVLQKIKKLYNPNLIITVDCGISCFKEVEFAKTLGMEVVVTDHHEIPEQLPKTIVLNAKLQNQKYGFNGLCGTGLVYKISEALIGKRSELFLPIACIATIADIVPLVSENRAIVYFGLQCLNKLPIGLRMLFKKLDINLQKCTATDVSFKVAPKLNASGRMGDAQDSLKLYLSEDTAECTRLINAILTHNDNRKVLCGVVENDCYNILNKVNLNAPSIVLTSSEWDQGILGIICAKLASEFNKPVFLFTEKDGELVGSARSIPGVNIHELLSDMKDILVTFGGHPVAAGLTIKSEHFNEFISRVNSYLISNYSEEIFVPKYYYDIEIQKDELTPKFLQDLNKLEPCGSDNESLKLFIKSNNFTFTPMRNYPQHCNIIIDSNLNLAYFNCDKAYPKLKYGGEVNIVFELHNNQKYYSLRGTVKAFEINIDNIKNIGKMEVIPYLEQIKYSNIGCEAEYSILNPEMIKINSYFGTAFVVNSELGFSKFMKYVDKEKICKLDICGGEENSGLNALIMYPTNLSFTKFYKKIIFLDPIVDNSYIAKINKISHSKVFVVNEKPYLKFFENINLEHDNFGLIYKDLLGNQGIISSLLDLFMKLRSKKFLKYSFKDFYSAVYVFQELNLIEIKRENGVKVLVCKSGNKTELAFSKYYQKLQNLKNIN